MYNGKVKCDFYSYMQQPASAVHRCKSCAKKPKLMRAQMKWGIAASIMVI